MKTKQAPTLIFAPPSRARTLAFRISADFYELSKLIDSPDPKIAADALEYLKGAIKSAKFQEGLVK
jgi:hypothetical protein